MTMYGDDPQTSNVVEDAVNAILEALNETTAPFVDRLYNDPEVFNFLCAIVEEYMEDDKVGDGDLMAEGLYDDWI